MPNTTNNGIFTLIMIPVGQHIEIKPLEVGATSGLKEKEVYQKGIVWQVSADVLQKIAEGDVILFNPANLIFINGRYLLQVDTVKLLNKQ